MTTLQQMETLVLAILEAQRNPLGCNESCVTQLVTRLAPSLKGANIGCNESCVTQLVTRLAPSLKGANITVVHQTPGSQGSLTMHNISTVQQSSGGR
jgi:hypothetical protein